MLNLKKNNSEQGFTIIEVLIVLAIAGLIMLIVFIVLPTLQRDQRNTSRKSDAGQISSAVGNFVSNSNGNLPATAADLTAIMTDAGNLSQLKDVTSTATSTSTSSVGSAATFTLDTAGAISPALNLPTSGANSMILDTKATCPATAGTTTTVGGTSRQAALLYTVEGSGTIQGSASADYSWDCIQAE